jgi:hypothetical protein
MIMAYVIKESVINDVKAPRWLASGKAKAHAFLIPRGELPGGAIKSVCGRSYDSEAMTDRADDRCKTCAQRTKEDTRKVGTGLSEPVLPVVNKGATAVPGIGARDGRAMMDGPALVKGPNMAPVQKTWRNPNTGDVEPAAAYLDGSLRDRIDREVAPPERPKRTKAQKRKFRARQTKERHLKARLARQSNGKRA